MSTPAVAREDHAPSGTDIVASITNIFRCGCCARVKTAILAAAGCI